MTRLLALAVLLCGCVLPSEFDKFTFSSDTQETVSRDGGTGSALDAGDLPGIDSGLEAGDASAHSVTEAGAQRDGGRDAGQQVCFDCGRPFCPSLEDEGLGASYVPDARALCPAGTNGQTNPDGPCRVSCRWVPGSTGSKDGPVCWDCQVPVCGDLGHVQLPAGTECPSATQGYSMPEGPCRIPCSGYP